MALQAKVNEAQKMGQSIGPHGYGGPETDAADSFYRSFIGKKQLCVEIMGGVITIIGKVVEYLSAIKVAGASGVFSQHTRGMQCIVA